MTVERAAAAPTHETCAVCLLPAADHFTGAHGTGDNVGCRGARAASVLFDRHLAKALGLGSTQFWKRKRRGDFAAFEVVPQLRCSLTRYSGFKVQQWLDGEPLEQGSGRKFFGKARLTHGPQSVARIDRRLREGGAR